MRLCHIISWSSSGCLRLILGWEWRTRSRASNHTVDHCMPCDIHAFEAMTAKSLCTVLTSSPNNNMPNKTTKCTQENRRNVANLKPRCTSTGRTGPISTYKKSNSPSIGASQSSTEWTPTSYGQQRPANGVQIHSLLASPGGMPPLGALRPPPLTGLNPEGCATQVRGMKQDNQQLHSTPAPPPFDQQ